MAKFEFDEREITVKQLRKMLRSVGVQYRRWGDVARDVRMAQLPRREEQEATHLQRAF